MTDHPVCRFFFHPDLPQQETIFRSKGLKRIQESHQTTQKNVSPSRITVGAVIPTARAILPETLPPDLARGLYRRSGFSPCPEDMRIQIYIKIIDFS